MKCNEYQFKESDVVMTPLEVARSIVSHFKPSGTILDPCRGNGAFYDLMPGADWCEIREGRNFYDCSTRYDWIVSNPPYSVFSDFLRHSFKIADNILYLIPANKVFNSYKMMREVAEYGGVAEMFVIGPGSKLKFPIGFCIAAVHIKKGYKGPMTTSFMD